VPEQQTGQATGTVEPHDPEAVDDGQARLELERFIPFRLSQLTNMVSNDLAAQYRTRFGISIPEWRVMAGLGHLGQASAGEVAAHGSMDKVKVSRAVARMLEAGLITRETDPRDNRASILRLSRRGRRIYDRIAALALAWEQQFLSPLSASEVAQLDDMLARLRDGMRIQQRT